MLLLPPPMDELSIMRIMFLGWLLLEAYPLAPAGVNLE